MAGNPRFEVSSGSPDGVSFVSNYSTTHRGHFTGGPSFERVGSFRDSHESRSLVQGGGSTNFSGNSSAGNGELPPLSQILSLDLVPSLEQKYARQLELRRAITAAAVGATSEDTPLGNLQAKPLDQFGPEELKRIKASISENSFRARERSRFMTEAMAKLDRYRSFMQSRKRARPEPSIHERPMASLSIERPANVGNSLKTSICASLNHANTLEGGTPKLEDKNKVAVPNKRVRTSMADVRLEGRPNNSSFQRASGLTDRERDSFRLSSTVGGSVEDRERLGSTVSEGWEKTKMKGRRSGSKQDANVATTANGALEGEREHKWGGQQRVNVDGRSRPSEGHGFRSGPVNGSVSIHKVESVGQQNGLVIRSINKSEYDGSPSVIEKGDRLGGIEKDRALPKNGVKPVSREESHLSSPTTVTKPKAARAPRSSSGAPVNPTAHAARAPLPSDSWERPLPSKVQLPAGHNNRKRPAPSRSSSPPVAQWVGQRPPKMARVARRMNLIPPVGLTSNREEAISTGEGISPRDVTAMPAARSNSSLSTGSGFARRAAVAPTLSQTKSKNGRVTPPTGFSDSDESEGGDVKSKDKAKKHGDSEGKFAVVSQKMGPLVVPKKSQVVSKEECGDGVRRQGRSGRGIVAVRGMTTVTPVEKADLAANAKQLRSTRPCLEKPDKSSDIKPGRPPTKKGAVDRKPLTRPRRPVSGAGELSGESDDDHEELVAAVHAAVNASAVACCSDFWKQMEPYFAFRTYQDLEYLRQQARKLSDGQLTVIIPARHEEREKIDVTKSSPASKPACLTNGTIEVDGALVSKVMNSFKDKQAAGRNEKEGIGGGWFEKTLPLSQRLLAALIIEDDSGTGSREDGTQNQPSDTARDGSPSGLSDSERAELERSEQELELDYRRLNGGVKCPPHDHILNSNGRPHQNSAANMLSDDLGEGDDIFNHTETDIYGHVAKAEAGKDDERYICVNAKRKEDQIVVHQSTSAVSGQISWDVHYQGLNLDDRILFELQSIGLLPEPVLPDLAQREDDEVGDQLQKFQLELKDQVISNKERIQALETAVLTRRENEEREREDLAMSKAMEITYGRRLGCRGGLLGASGSKGSGTKGARATTLALTKRMMARWRNYAETGQSCFTDAALRDILFCVSSKESEGKDLANFREAGEGCAANVATALGPSESKSAVVASPASDGTGRPVCEISGIEKADKESSESGQITSTSLEQFGGKDDIWSSRVKEREVLLEDVVGSSTMIEPTVLGGIKGKRSERERDGKGQSKESLGRSGCSKGGRQGLSSIKGERKTKTKPRQKTGPLLKAVTGLLEKSAELPKENVTSLTTPPEKSVEKFKVKSEAVLSTLSVQEAPLETEGAIDLSHLQLPGMEDLAGQGPDFGSLFDFDDPGLQDAPGDFVGLDVPMDDLSELAMMM